MPDPLTRERRVDALRGVFDPELGSDVVDLGMVREVTINGGVVTVGLALTIAECPMRSQIENDTVRKIKAIPAVEDVVVETRAMTKAQRAEHWAETGHRGRRRRHRSTSIDGPGPRSRKASTSPGASPAGRHRGLPFR